MKLTKNEKLVHELKYELRKLNSQIKKLEIASFVMSTIDLYHYRYLQSEVQNCYEKKKNTEENIKAIMDGKPVVHQLRKDYY